MNYHITGDDTFDLSRTQYYLNAAIGQKYPSTPMKLLEHKERGVTDERIFLGEYSEFVDSDVLTYIGCGVVRKLINVFLKSKK